VLGNTLLAQARQHSVIIDEQLSTLVDDLNREVVQARDQVVADVERTTQIAYSIVALAIILGIATTLIVLRSILVPLREVVTAMDGITAGDLNTPIPPAATNEIGTMAKTLRLFRESIVERTRLAEEGERQRRMIETSLRTIPDGFVLYDSDDRLVLNNSKFVEFTPGIADLIKPGVAFSDILRAVVDRKMVDFGSRNPDEWVAERMRQHAEPDFRNMNITASGSELASGARPTVERSLFSPTSLSSNAAKPSSKSRASVLTPPMRPSLCSLPT
jgi:HAMP domain-containing protein